MAWDRYAFCTGTGDLLFDRRDIAERSASGRCGVIWAAKTFQQVTNHSSNRLALVEKLDGEDELVLTSPDELEDPLSLVRLRNEIATRLARVDLPEILLETAARTDFKAKFTHISER